MIRWLGLIVLDGFLILNTILSLKFGCWYFAVSNLLVILGAVCNRLACSVNDGKMPVRVSGVDYHLFGWVVGSKKHCVMDQSTRLVCLCDVIKVPVSHDLASVGDVIMFIGVASYFVDCAYLYIKGFAAI